MPNIIEYINIGNTDYTIVDSTAEHPRNKATSFQESPTDARYPSEKLVKDSLDLKLDKASIATIMPDVPNDNTVPSTKLLSESLTGFAVNNEDKLDKTSVVSNFQGTPDNTHVPSEKLVYDSLEGKVNTSVVVSAFQEFPSNVRIPSEKLVYDTLQLIQQDISDISTSEVVTSLPSLASADEDTDYILVNNGSALHYRKINGEWVMVGGSVVSVVDELPEDGLGNPLGNSNTDYYVATSNENIYLHYRWMDEYTIPAEEPGEEDTVVDGHFYSVGTESYTKAQIDGLIATLNGSISAVSSDVSTLSRAVTTNAQNIAALDVEPYRYDAELSQSEGVYTYTLYETRDDVQSVRSQFVLPAGGGGGGGGGATTLTVTKITPSPVVATKTDRIVLEVNYSSVDGDNEDVDGNYVLKAGTTVIKSGFMYKGLNSYDVTDYCTVGTTNFTLTVTDEGGSMTVKTWKVQIVDVRLESSFNDESTYAVGSSVNFTYTPYGAISKTVHFKLDGITLESVTTSVSGILQSYTINAQTRGTHLLETWITATIGTETVETPHIFKDIIWYDVESTAPVIGCEYRYDYHGRIETKQYDTVQIPYVVYDPTTSTPEVSLLVDGNVVNTLTLTEASNIWSFKSSDVAEHILIIRCRSTSVIVRVNVSEIGYNIAPVTANLDFDFNPSGITNASANRLWTDSNNSSIQLSVSPNFDWNNGGYQLDEEGNTYFAVKSGTRAYISHNLFGRSNIKETGAEFKVVFKTENVANKDAVFLSCKSVEGGNENPFNVGLEMRAHEAYIYNNSGTLYNPYSEEDIIEFEYNITPIDTSDNEATSFVMTYEDGVASRPLMYSNSTQFHQISNIAPITIGSDDCDVRIYRMKSYSASLSDTSVLANFIADARDSDTIIARYTRNQIYNSNNELDPATLADACPDLRIIKIDAPYFTNDKKNYVRYTNVECIYKNGDPVLDNWVFRNGAHAGQGTTSNAYGLAGRNIDIIFGHDGEVPVLPSAFNMLEEDGVTKYISELTLGDGTKSYGKNAKVSLTRNSVPNWWFNIKVNIASSENANNALFQKRYNDYLPYKTPAMKRDPHIKNDMEFVNCVIFIRENDPDVSKHREFDDNNWHFYAIGNIGDSKKTDSTRVTDNTDPNEFVVEISDNKDTNSTFDTGVYYDATGNITYDVESATAYENTPDGIPSKVVYPVTYAQWTNPNNVVHTALVEDWDGSFEFRYDLSSKDGETINATMTAQMQEANKQVFRDMYEFVVTSSNDDFVNHFGDWFIEESYLYWYLFTERYTMIDNRAKNSFWHWGKTYITEAEAAELGETDASYFVIDNAAASINNGYRFDLWDYDNDTAIGIDNNGELNQTYGSEDIDYRVPGDSSTGYVFNAAESVLWRRIRTLMHDKLRAMYLSRETLGCWRADSLINEFDAWQEQFPEELWRLDIERKYLRPYYTGNTLWTTGGSPTSWFLSSMMNGRKKYQRRQFERNQEIYIGTKYVGLNQCNASTAIQFRVNRPDDVIVTPNYTIEVVPYSDMYLSVLFGNVNANPIRAVAGQSYTFSASGLNMTDTQVLIYCAENIQSLSNLAACYIKANNFASAKRLKTLQIGSGIDGYQNNFITELNLGNNELLEVLDIRNCPNLTGELRLIGCPNLKTLYAEGTSINVVTFATNGKITTAHLPGTVNSLTMRSLNYIQDFTLASYNSLVTLISEYCAYDPKTIVESAINTLQTVSLLGINWTTYGTTTLNKILEMYSSAMSGTVTITGPVRQSELDAYEEAWQDLTVIYDSQNIVPQRLVTYLNKNGDVLYQYLCDIGATTIDPVDEGLIPTPTTDPDEQYTYTFNGWEGLTTVTSNTTVTAKYRGTVRTYRVSWYAHNGDAPLYVRNVTYGNEAVYSGDLPIDIAYESIGRYKLFRGWDKNTGRVTGDMDVYARWTEAMVPESGTPLNQMTPTQIYAVSSAGRAGSMFSIKDYFEFKIGPDYDFANVESAVLLENQYFDGTNYVTRNVDLFSSDAPSFTLAIDFETLANSDGLNVLVSSYDASIGSGFYLNDVNSSPVVHWMTSTVSANICASGRRNMVVLRHQAGSGVLYIYSSRCGSESINYYALNSGTYTLGSTSGATPTATNGIVFGAMQTRQNNTYRYTNNGKGWIHWCKIWYDDLGADCCQKLARFPREKFRMEYVGSSRQARADNNIISDYAGASFIANNLTSMYIPTNNTGSESYSWEGTLRQRFCNEYIYPSLPYELQSAIATVKVKCYASSTGSTTVTSENDIYLPSAGDLYNNSSYTAEVDTGPVSFYSSSVSISTTYTPRIKWPGLVVEDRDYATPGKRYFNSGADPAENGEVLATGDIWRSSSGGALRMYISADDSTTHKYIGVTQLGTSTASVGGGHWVPSSYYGLRSFYRGSSGNMIAHVWYDDGYLTGTSSKYYPLCIAFSI